MKKKVRRIIVTKTVGDETVFIKCLIDSIISFLYLKYETLVSSMCHLFQAAEIYFKHLLSFEISEFSFVMKIQEISRTLKSKNKI